MSASIYWDSVSPGKYLGVNSSSQFIATCEKVFGSLPLTLKEEDVVALRTLAALEPKGDNPWQSLVNKIDKYGAIKVWASY